MPVFDVLIVLGRRLVWLARGWARTLLQQGRPKMVFMGPAVSLRHSARIVFSSGVTLERGVIIDGLSRDGVHLGKNVMIGAYSILRAAVLTTGLGVGVRIGDESAIEAYSFIGASGGVTIGNCVIMGQHVSFHAENHEFDRCDVPIKSQGVRRIGIVIEADCWIGSNVTFLDGAYVETGCVIGAGSVVRGRIPSYSVAVGVPARVVKSRKVVSV
jgi:acetyltransferase-like isoleucine patch superfamily enzyme